MTLASNDEDEEPTLESDEDVEGAGSVVEPSLENLTKDNLLKLASEKGIESVSARMTKAQIVELLNKA